MIAQARSPSPLRARAESAPANSRDELPVIGARHFRLRENDGGKRCRDVELSADWRTPEMIPRQRDASGMKAERPRPQGGLGSRQPGAKR